MKRTFIRIMAWLCIVSICLGGVWGCSKAEQADPEKVSESEESGKGSGNTEEEGEPSGEAEGERQEESVDLPDGFVQASDSTLKGLPEHDGLVEAESDLVQSIGVTGINALVYGNYRKNASSAMIDAYAVTDIDRKIIVSMLYSEIDSVKKWTGYKIVDADTGNCYFIEEKFRDTYTLYDYKTGEQIVDNAETEAEAEATAKPSTHTGSEISELEISGENIIDVVVRDMKEYDYVKDVYIEVDENENDISIVVQVPKATDEATAKMAGEDVARYLAATAGMADSQYELPDNDDIGGIYDKYDLLIYIDDGNHTFDIYGAKVATSRKITWR